MTLKAVVELLQRRIGLDPTSLGSSVVPAAVADEMRSFGLRDATAYAGRLTSDPDAFAALVERLVVPETWFFRGPGLFEELAHMVARFTGGRAFRALSMPCSSGEEPYSLAVALFEAGVPPERWTIEGYDLSPRLIVAARRGVYREFSFRQTEPHLRDRYFRRVADGWVLAERVRGSVRFDVGNIADPAFLSGVPAVYDLILCRNLLIYLTPAARGQALTTLERLLVPGGLLAVGVAEPQALAGRPFRRAGSEPHFLFRYEPPGNLKSDEDPRFKVVHRPAPVSLPSASPSAATSSVAGLCESGRPHRGQLQKNRREQISSHPLDRARRLADAGQLDDALAEVSRAGSTADAFSLLGVIQQALGDRAAAASAFRKALYLDPAHREALTHAMLLANEQGDADRAAVLRERLARSGGES
jgi:chemotaxis protein methyltransferase WspC